MTPNSHVFVTTVEGNNVRIKTPPSIVVRGASTANIADLTAASTTFDGLTLVAGDVVLLKNQSTTSQNGVYAVGDVSGSTAALTRIWPLESGVEAINGMTFYVQAGTANGGEWWYITNTGTITVGTTGLTFSQLVGSVPAELASTSNGEGASGVGVEDAGAYYTGTDVEAALAEVGALAVKKRSATIGHAALTDADTSQTVNIGTTLPANARIVGVSIHTVTAFSGGTVSALAVDIGTSGDVDAIVDGADLFGTVVDGQAATLPPGIAPNKLFASAGAQLIATIVSTGDNLVNLTAGAMTIDVLFVELA